MPPRFLLSTVSKLRANNYIHFKKKRKRENEQLKYFVTNAHKIAPFEGYRPNIIFKFSSGLKGMNPLRLTISKELSNKNTTLFKRKRNMIMGKYKNKIFIKNGH